MITKSKVVSILLSLILMLSLVFLGTPLEAKKTTTNADIQLAKLLPGEDYVAGEIIVEFESAEVKKAAIAQLNSKYGTSVKETGLSGFKILKVPENKTVLEMVELFSKESSVKYAEPNYIVKLSWTPNDTHYSLQWHFDANHIHMPQAWDLDTTAPTHGGDSSVIVAVVDTGIAYETYGPYTQAPDLASTTFIAGYDFVNNDSHPNDDQGHGTHVTGTIAQSTNNGYGVAGIAFKSSIMPVKVLNSAGSGTVAQIANGITYAKNQGADVINMSIESQYDSQTMHDAIIGAKNAGLVIVAAAGNGKRPISEGGDGIDGTGDPTLAYPAAYSECIAVGATDWANVRSPYSNYGTGIDVVAPGGDTSADLNGDL